MPAALLLNEAFRGRNLLRGFVLFPYMIPTIVAVILWKWLLNDSYGLVNHLLLQAGLVRAPVAWLGPDYIMTALIVTSVWQFFPFVVVTYLARLQTIAPELYEAAHGGRGLHVAPVPPRHPAPDRERALRDRAAALHLDVHQVRHGVAAGRRGRGEPLHPHPAGLRLLAQLHLPPGRDGRRRSRCIMFAMLLVATAIYFRMFRTEEVFS